MIKHSSIAAVAAALVFAFAAPHAAVAADAPAAQVQWQGVGRVIAFADVHGAYTELTGLLQSVGVIDQDLHWSAGRTHVVSLGDLLDRGPDSRKVMDLLMRLQDEAAAAGGQLHVVLGNHEAMELTGDTRYASAADYGSYAADEPAGLREKLRSEWIARDGPDAGAAFDKRFPPGYFGQRALLSPSGKYGRWLLSLPAAIVIDDTLFMHGGPSRVVAGMSLPEINLRYRTAVTDYLGSLAALESDGLLREGDGFDARPQLAAQRMAALPAATDGDRAKLAEDVRRFTAADQNPMLGSDGPNWYRGEALCRECSESDVLKPILAGLGVKRLVIGHTVVRNARVVSRFDGTVFKLDAGMNRDAYHGRAAALLIEPGKPPQVAYADAPGTFAAVPAEPLYVAPGYLDDDTVHAILETGTVTLGPARSPDATDAVVERDGHKVPAVFVAVGAEAVSKELAAYRLDRMLGLGLVPATVARDIEGRRGYLQARPQKWVTQDDVQARHLGGGGWCALPPQFDLVYAFDALSGNAGRSGANLLYDATEWNAFLTGHDKAFGTSRDFPAYLKGRTLAPGAELRRRLAALDEASLGEKLGDVLDKREIKAILARRDELLALPAAAAAR